MLFQVKSRGTALRRRWEGRCLGHRRRGICGGLGGRATPLSTSTSKPHFSNPKEEGETYPKASTIRNPNRQIRNHRKRAIQLRLPERQIMANLMDGQEQILVCRRADHVCCAPEAPGPEGRVLEGVGAEALDGDDEQDEVFG